MRERERARAHPNYSGIMSARSRSTGRRIMFSSGILVFLVGVAITIITPDAIALGLALLGIGVVLVSLSGAQRNDAEGPAADTHERTS